MFARLIPTAGGSPIEIERDVTVVGRSRDHCDVRIDRNSVSKIHCVIVKTDGLLFVRDLGSTNGTKVNGQRILRGALLPGDQLAFANVKYRVQLGAGERRPESDRTEMIAMPRAAPGTKQPSDASDDELEILE